MRSRDGFTLFEVMAAVLVLGVLYTTLASSAIDGLRSEGESRRRLAASLLADATLTSIETSLASGSAPELGDQEETVEEFTVQTSVRPFDATPLLTAEIEVAEAALPMLTGTDDAPLRIVDVKVAWQAALGVSAVERTTLVYDSAAIAELLPDDGDGGESAGGGDTTPEAGTDEQAIQDMLRTLEAIEGSQ